MSKKRVWVRPLMAAVQAARWPAEKQPKNQAKTWVLARRRVTWPKVLNSRLQRAVTAGTPGRAAGTMAEIKTHKIPRMLWRKRWRLLQTPNKNPELQKMKKERWRRRETKAWDLPRLKAAVRATRPGTAVWARLQEARAREVPRVPAAVAVIYRRAAAWI